MAVEDDKEITKGDIVLLNSLWVLAQIFYYRWVLALVLAGIAVVILIKAYWIARVFAPRINGSWRLALLDTVYKKYILAILWLNK